MADGQQKTQPDFSPIPKAEFNPRTGAPLSAIDLDDNSNAEEIPGPRASNKVEPTKPTTSGTPKRGMFLKNRLGKLYNDPMYKNADPSLQQYYKEQAYDKWVAPYYKHVGMNAPSKEEFLTGKPKSKMGIAGWYQSVVDASPGIGMASLKETSKITGGLAGLLSYAGAGIDWIAGSNAPEKEGGLARPGVKDKNLEEHLKDLQGYFKDKENYYDDRLRDLNNGQDPTWRKNPSQKITQLATEGVFFEATGAGKAAKLFRLANPRTAALATRMVKSSWNTAVGFGLWSASQGDTPREIAQSTETGAALGPLGALTKRVSGLDKFHDMLATMFKSTTPEASKLIVSDAISKASDGHGSELIQAKPKSTNTGVNVEPQWTREEMLAKVQTLLKNVQNTEAKARAAGKLATPLTPESQVASSAIAVRLQSMSHERYEKPFDKLPWIQQRGIINRFLANDMLASKLSADGQGPSAEVLHTMIKEQQENLNKVSPQAEQVNKVVGEFIKSNGGKPEVQKLKAVLPHHNTDIESPWKHIQARTSFLKSQMRRFEPGSVEHTELKAALNDEYALMQKKAELEVNVKNRTKPGAAVINDTIAFKGDDLLVRPSSPSDSSIFGTWRDDKIAGEIHEQIIKSSPVGAMDRKAQAIMTSFQAGSMLEVFAKDRFQDTVVLHHNQYGPIGGANYSVIEDRGGKLGKTLMLNWIALRPNVVAKVFDTPGAGQALFLNMLERARATGAGVELHSAPSAENFYRKMGMEDAGEGNFKLSADAVKKVLTQRGLIAALLAAGVSGFAVSNEDKYQDVSVTPKDKK